MGTDAAHRLAALKPGEAVEAIAALMVVLQHSDVNWRTRLAAVGALRVIGNAAIPALVNGLHRGSYQVRLYSAMALKEIGAPPELLPRIDEIIRAAHLSEDENVDGETGG